jgi:transcriptional regulator GlxA family with amidase domain
MGLQLVHLKCRSATRWPTNARLNALAGGASKPRKRHRHRAKQRRDVVSPPVLQMVFSVRCYLEPKSGRVENALAYAKRNLDRPLKVEQLARAAHLSLPQFSRAFRAETGQSPAKAVERCASRPPAC